MNRLLIPFLVLIITPLLIVAKPEEATTQKPSVYVLNPPSPVFATESRFSEKSNTTIVPIPFAVEYQDDPASELDSETIKVTGINGEKEVTTVTTYYDEQEFDQITTEKVTKTPQNQLVLRGTKPVPKTIATEHGVITYLQKLTGFWATSYDSTCPGCGSFTFTGMKQGFGVVAVDPTVIPLYTKLYIPGYGLAVAGDIGGAVKGKRLDLGYDSLMGQWAARYVDVYILAPEN
ncbi:hypothetical protein A2783_01480 [Microgenomates group bacterium RIFCSPHIGHO2_01_FULL_45_11]|nr:MAG: hypothetical protein A2783_01480 [Microgenomates group bacterium RIFCSPHIGHO2_01_FULL_45_11]